MTSLQDVLSRKKILCSERDLTAELYNLWITKMHDFQDNKEKYEMYLKMIDNLEPYANMVKEEIAKVLDEEGISHNYLIKRFKQVADSAEREGDVLRSLESLAKIAGLFDSQETEKQQLTVWQGFSPEQLKAVEDKKPVLIGEKDV